jgi:hypothetical protein
MMLAVTAISGGWWSRHGGHTLVIAIPALVIGGIAVWADVRAAIGRRRSRGRSRPQLSMPIRLAALFSLGTAAVHGAVCPEHFKEAALYGVFFLTAAACQAGWAVLAWTRPRRWLLYAGAAGNAAIIALWAVTRTNGVPLGPGRGETEAIGALDIIATSCEIAIVLCAVLALRSVAHAVARTPVTAVNA